jgi:CheY-like chemotaxis protein
VATILVVDDEAANREILAIVLEHAGHIVHAARDGAEGLAVAREFRPDLAIIDIFMPGVDGVDLVKSLRADPELSATTIALYTATLPDRAMRQYMEVAGIEHAIPKPSEPDEIIAVVNGILAPKR